jgi:phosphatidylinositol alpha-1,6-mannosyltransferase
MHRGCRILALITDGFGARGGIARFNADLMQALSQSERVDAVVTLPRFGDVHAVTPTKVLQVAPEPGRARWSARAARLAIGGRFDVILCGHINAAPLAAGLASATGARLWLQVHGIEAWEARGALVRWGVESARLVTSVSRFTRKRLLAWARIAPEHVRVLPNTVGREFAPRPRREDLIARHHLADRKVILTVSRLAASERYKGHDRVIRALPAVAERCGLVSYLIVGSGDDRPRLEALAHARGVAERVTFAGEVAAADLPDYFALADVYAMPSTGEGFGIVFLEAAASGLCVIGGNRDGSADALADGRIGHLVDPDDAAGLRSALVEALAPEGLAEPRRLEAVQRFRFDNFARHVDDLVGAVTAADRD